MLSAFLSPRLSTALVTLASASVAVATPPTIQAIQPPSSLYPSTAANAVNGDGTVVVGEAFDLNFDSFLQGVRWSNSVTQSVQGSVRVYAVNPTGNAFAGTRFQSGVPRSSFVTRPSGTSGLFDFQGDDRATLALSMTPDARFVVGSASNRNRNVAARWNESNQIESLGDLPDGTQDSVARSISDSGSVVVGRARTSTGDRAFVWTASAGMTSIGLAPGYSGSVANAVTADGSSIFGDLLVGPQGREGDNTPASRAFRWNSSSGFSLLPMLSGATGSTVTDITPDGGIAIGTSYTGPSIFSGVPVIFTPTQAIDFRTLVLSSGVDLSGWDLQSLVLTDISDDGSTLVGNGNFGGASRGFVLSGLNIPAPASAALLALAGLSALRRRR